jgi:hypothetical protein
MNIAQIATIPGREFTVEIAERSLWPQVDVVNVIRNSPTDGLKFSGLTNYSLNDVVFICDDDIGYPPDYVKVMLSYLKPGIVITCMGKVLHKTPIESYYHSGAKESYKALEDCHNGAMVDIPGTGVMAFHRATCPNLDETYFKSIGSDVWMGVYCKLNKIPCYVIPHRAEWLTNLMGLLPKESPSVFGRYKNNDSHMTELINKYF